MTPANTPRIRVGIGGWSFEPWRNNFYPQGLPQNQELAYASRKLGSIEVNATYYSSFKPATFGKWHDETPDDFVFSLKAPRFATNRRQLAAAGESVARFIGSGIAELGNKLGPLVWQFMPAKIFEPDDFEAFLRLLPDTVGGCKLRHVLDVRHDSFDTPEFLALARRYRCVAVHTDSDDYPSITDAGGDFAYLRLMRCQSDVASGYSAAALDQWAEGSRAWASGSRPRAAFVYFINGAKERAPAAAQALQARLA